MPTKYAGNETQTRALNVYITLMRASNAVTLRVHRHLKKAGLTIGQFAALEALHHLGAMRQNELAGKLLCSPGNLSTVVSNLERRRLIRRKADAADARCTVVVATDRGKAIMRRVFPIHVSELVKAFEVLSSQEQGALRSLCRKLGRAQG